MPDSLWLLLLLLPIAVWMGYRIGIKKHQSSSSPDSSKYFKGINYLLNEQPDKAIDVFIEQIKVDNELVETHLALGNLFRRRGEVDRAIRIHQNIIARPTLETQLRQLALRELSQDYLSAGLYDRAESILSELKQHESDLEFALQNLTSVYQQLKDWPQAIDASMQLKSIGDNTQEIALCHFYCELADAAFSNADTKSVLTHLKKAMKFDADNLRANLLLARHYMNDSVYKKAQKIFQSMCQKHPTYLQEFITPMRECYAELGQEKQYVSLLEAAVDEGNNNHALPELLSAISDETEPSIIERRLLEQLRHSGSTVVLQELLKFYRLHSDELHQVRFQSILQSIGEANDSQDNYHCDNCGYASHNLIWQCPSCKLWGTMQPLSELSVRPAQLENLDVK